LLELLHAAQVDEAEVIVDPKDEGCLGFLGSAEQGGGSGGRSELGAGLTVEDCEVGGGGEIEIGARLGGAPEGDEELASEEAGDLGLVG
jgi:hypothetical protein